MHFRCTLFALFFFFISFILTSIDVGYEWRSMNIQIIEHLFWGTIRIKTITFHTHWRYWMQIFLHSQQYRLTQATEYDLTVSAVTALQLATETIDGINKNGRWYYCIYSTLFVVLLESFLFVYSTETWLLSAHQLPWLYFTHVLKDYHTFPNLFVMNSKRDKNNYHVWLDSLQCITGTSTSCVSSTFSVKIEWLRMLKLHLSAIFITILRCMERNSFCCGIFHRWPCN